MPKPELALALKLNVSVVVQMNPLAGAEIATTGGEMRTTKFVALVWLNMFPLVSAAPETMTCTVPSMFEAIVIGGVE